MNNSNLDVLSLLAQQEKTTQPMLTAVVVHTLVVVVPLTLCNMCSTIHTTVSPELAGLGGEGSFAIRRVMNEYVFRGSIFSLHLHTTVTHEIGALWSVGK